MLRVEMHDGDGKLVMNLYGRLTAEYSEQIRMLVAHCNPETRLLVDLTEVTFIDAVGEQALSLIGQQCGQFIAGNVYAKEMCKRLHLPLARNRQRKRHQNSF